MDVGLVDGREREPLVPLHTPGVWRLANVQRRTMGEKLIHLGGDKGAVLWIEYELAKALGAWAHQHEQEEQEPPIPDLKTEATLAVLALASLFGFLGVVAWWAWGIK